MEELANGRWNLRLPRTVCEVPLLTEITWMFYSLRIFLSGSSTQKCLLSVLDQGRCEEVSVNDSEMLCAVALSAGWQCGGFWVKYVPVPNAPDQP